MASFFTLTHILAFALATISIASDESDESPKYSVLMVVTSHSKLGDTGTKTGWYLPEAAHPYSVFKKLGVKMTWASPQGGEAPVDPSSVKAYSHDPESMAFYHQNDGKLMTEKLEDMDADDFDAIFVVGGYGVMWDLVGDEDLEALAAEIYESGGVVSGVCHGPAALVGVKLSDGTRLVKDKKVACFSNKEEDQLKRRDVVPKTCETAFKEAGADYTQGKPWSDHVVTAGRLVTGQNPMSAMQTAVAVYKALVTADYEDNQKDAHTSSNAAENAKNAVTSENALEADLSMNAMLATNAMTANKANKAMFAGQAVKAKYAKEAVYAQELGDGKMKKKMMKDMKKMKKSPEAKMDGKKAKANYAKKVKKMTDTFDKAINGKDSVEYATNANFAREAVTAHTAINALEATNATNAHAAKHAMMAKMALEAHFAGQAKHAKFALHAKHVVEKFEVGTLTKNLLAAHNSVMLISLGAIVFGAIVSGFAFVTWRISRRNRNTARTQEDEELLLNVEAAME